MRNLMIPIAAGAALALGACATQPAYYNPTDRTAAAYDPVYLQGTLAGTYDSAFDKAAAQTCTQYAGQYGTQPGVMKVESINATHRKVMGVLKRGLEGVNWTCTYRSDGAITAFTF